MQTLGTTHIPLSVGLNKRLCDEVGDRDLYCLASGGFVSTMLQFK